MNTIKTAAAGILLAGALPAWSQSVWLPEKGSLIVAPGYTYQTFNEFTAGTTLLKLPADIVQQSAFLNFDYGIAPALAADFNIGYTRVDFQPPGSPNFLRDGLDDTRLGLRYRFVDENAGGNSWIPALALRVGGVFAGSYTIPNSLPPINPGDGANGFETSLLFGKTFGETGFGAYGDFGGRVRDHDAPAVILGNVGLFKHLGPVTLNVGYRHFQGLTGGDIGGPGFGTAFGFPQTREISRLIEMDAMLGTLDFVARSDWRTILPGIMMAVDDSAGRLKINPLVNPPLLLDLVLIEPSRKPMPKAAQVFLALLEAEAVRLNARWETGEAPAAPKPVIRRKTTV